MTTAQKTSLANAAVVAFAASVVVPLLLMVVAVKVLGKRLIDLGPIMFVLWVFLLATLALAFFTRDTPKGRYVLIAATLLPVLMVTLKFIAALIGA